MPNSVKFDVRSGFVSEETPNRRIELGRRIKELRGKMTAKELAAKSGVSPSYLSEVEKGISAISLEKLRQLAEHLGVTLDELVGTGSNEAKEKNGDLRLPRALVEAAAETNMTLNETIKLFNGISTLRARPTGKERELSKQDWIDAFETVRKYME
jgi:transcriptional regulator with XRE-family HTH domain